MSVSCLWPQQPHCTSSALDQCPPLPPLEQHGQVHQDGEASQEHLVAGNLGRWKHGHLPEEVVMGAMTLKVIKNLAHVKADPTGPGAITNWARFTPQGWVKQFAYKKGTHRILREISCVIKSSNIGSKSECQSDYIISSSVYRTNIITAS